MIARQIVDVLAKALGDKLTARDRLLLEKEFIRYGHASQAVQASGLGSRSVRIISGNTTVDEGLWIVNPDTGKLVAVIDQTGDVRFGLDVEVPAQRFFSFFSNDRVYNGESIGEGSLLLGDNSSGAANLLWDPETRRLNFRGGQVTKAYIDTDGHLVATGAVISGSLTAAGGDVVIDASGISLLASGALEGAIKFKDGSIIRAFIGAEGDNITGNSAIWSRATTEYSGAGPYGIVTNSVLANSQGTGSPEGRVLIKGTPGSGAGTYLELMSSYSGVKPTIILRNGQVHITGDSGSGTILLVSNNDVQIYGDLALSGSLNLGGNLQGTTTLEILDDRAISFTPPNDWGLLLVYRRGGAAPAHGWGLVVYRAINPALAAKLDGHADYEVTTGALNGTTGNDTKFTISAHTDGKIYLENRLGAAITMHYILLGG